MTHKPITFAEAYKNHLKKTQQQNTKDLTPTKNPDLYAPLLMPPEGYFDHIGAKRAKRAQERIPLIIEHLTKEPTPDTDITKPGARSANRTFGTPAASLHNALEFPPPRWDKQKKLGKVKAGIKGEELTAQALAKWADDKPDVVICHSVSIPRKEGDDVETEMEVVALDGEDDDDLNEERESLTSEDKELGLVDSPDTDHVLVIGSNVWIIDSKMWSAGVDLNDPKATYQFRYPPKGKKPNYAVVAGGGYPRYLRMKQAIHLWKKYLGGEKRAHVEGIVNIHAKEVKNPEREKNPDAPEMIPGTLTFLRLKQWWTAPFKPTDNDRFIELLDKWYKAIRDDQKGYIDVGLVTLVARTPVKRVTRAEKFFGDNLQGFM